MKSLGISVEETGAIYGLSAVIGVLTPFGLGLIADKLGNFKMLLSALFGFAGITALLFLLVPVGRISVVYPTDMSMALGCFDDNSTLALTDLDLHPCDFKINQDSSVINVSATIGECGSVCYLSDGWSGTETSLGTAPTFVNETDKKLPIGKGFSEAVFFPRDYSLDVTCSAAATISSEVDCTLNRRNSIEQNQPKIWIGLDLASDYSGNTTGKYRVNWMTTEGGTRIGLTASSFQCVSDGEKPKLHYTVNSQNNQAANNRTFYQMCQSQCIVHISRSDTCSNKVREEVFNPQFTFWMYLLLRLIFDVLMSGSNTLFDGASLVLVNEVRGDYGFQKMFGFIGLAIFSPISGALIDYFSEGDQGNIRPAFYLFAVFFGIATIGTLSINLSFKPPAQNLIKDVKLLLENVELDLLLIIAYISGISVGYGGFCLFLFLQEIGGTKALMGLSNTVQSVAVIPLLILSDRIFRKLSHPNVQVICLGVSVIRLTGYSYLEDPRLCLLLESLEAISWNFARISHVAYANELGTKTTIASIHGLLSGITFGLGCGTGSIGGGLLIGVYGLRVTFRILGAISFTTGLLYFLLNIFYLRQKKANAKVKKSEKVDQNSNVACC